MLNGNALIERPIQSRGTRADVWYYLYLRLVMVYSHGPQCKFWMFVWALVYKL